MRNPANKLVKTLQQQHLTLALAESVTCGLAAHRLAGVKGTSQVLRGSVVCYTPQVKNTLLKVPVATMQKYTCESAQVTKALVMGLKKIIKADVYAAVTGLAAPGGSETKDKPVGTVFIHVQVGSKNYSERWLFKGSPLQIRAKACVALYNLIIKKVQG